MTTLPGISLVTCSFRQARYLEMTLRSVLEQRYPDLQYVVIDGGSDDGSAATLRRYAARLDYWVSEPDRGQTDALIKGFRRCDRDIMGWLCSDDLLLPGALEFVGHYFAQHPDVDAMFGDALWIGGDGGFLRPKREMAFSRFVLLNDHNFVPQPSMFWRRRLYDAVGGLDPGFSLAMDGDLWARFAARTHIAHVPRYLSCMRWHASQKTQALRPQALGEGATLRERYSRSPPAASVVAARWLARAMRVTMKLCAGGYWARAPREHLAWIREQARTLQ